MNRDAGDIWKLIDKDTITGQRSDKEVSLRHHLRGLARHRVRYLSLLRDQRHTRLRLNERPIHKLIPGATLVLTSAGRRSLLAQTASSLKRNLVEFDTPWLDILVVDDDPSSKETREFILQEKSFPWIRFNTQNLGLARTLSYAFPAIRTEYVAYWQDDWELLHRLSLRDAIQTLEEYNFDQLVFRREPIKSAEYRGARPLSDLLWHRFNLFTLNPFVARTSIVNRHVPFETSLGAEAGITKSFLDSGRLDSGILSSADGPYVRHLGNDESALSRLDFRSIH